VVANEQFSTASQFAWHDPLHSFNPEAQPQVLGAFPEAAGAIMVALWVAPELLWQEPLTAYTVAE
jgi:hypothetical protein